jgi:hypothetical protein
LGETFARDYGSRNNKNTYTPDLLMRSIMKTQLAFLTLSVFVLIVGLSVLPAFAEQIQIHVTGLNFKYDGTDIFDSTAKAGGNNNTAEADPVTTIDFFVDDSYVGSLTSSDKIFTDLLIDNVLNIPKTGGMITSGDGIAGFGLDLLQKTGAGTTALLSLNINQLTVSYSGMGIFIAAGGLADSVVAQNLPFGLAINTDDQVSLLVSSSYLTKVTNSGNYLSGFDAFGTADINGTLVPEPNSLIALLGFAAVSLLALIRRRR